MDPGHRPRTSPRDEYSREKRAGSLQQERQTDRDDEVSLSTELLAKQTDQPTGGNGEHQKEDQWCCESCCDRPHL